MLTVVTDIEPTPAGMTAASVAATTTGGSLLDEIVRDGARRMLAAALEAEVAAYAAAPADQLDVRSALPKSAHPGARRTLAEIWNAEDREHARRAVAAVKLAYGAKFGKAGAKIIGHLEAPHLVALVRAGVRLERGRLVERPETAAA